MFQGMVCTVIIETSLVFDGIFLSLLFVYYSSLLELILMVMSHVPSKHHMGFDLSKVLDLIVLSFSFLYGLLTVSG